MRTGTLQPRCHVNMIDLHWSSTSNVRSASSCETEPMMLHRSASVQGAYMAATANASVGMPYLFSPLHARHW